MIMKEILSEDYIDDSELVINKDNKVEEKYTELIKEQNNFLNALVENIKENRYKNMSKQVKDETDKKNRL